MGRSKKYQRIISYNTCRDCMRIFKFKPSEQISKLYLKHRQVVHNEYGKYIIENVRGANQKNQVKYNYNTPDDGIVYHK